MQGSWIDGEGTANSSNCAPIQSKEVRVDSRNGTTATPGSALSALDSECGSDFTGLDNSSSIPSSVLRNTPSPAPKEKSDLLQTLQQVEQESVKGMLHRLDSIRQLAGHAQVLRRKESREKNNRRLHIEQMFSLLMEEEEFKPQAVRQRNVLAMLEGIHLHCHDIFFFSIDEANRGIMTPSVQLRDALARPQRIATKLLVDAEILSRMFAQLTTRQILEIVSKCTEYLAFKQTTYQVKPVEEPHDNHGWQVRNVSGLACFMNYFFATDAVNDVLWRVSMSRFTAQGNHQVELFAGVFQQGGLQDGPRLSSMFSNPTGIVVSQETQEIFVADTGNNAIRRIDLRHQVVSTISLHLSPVHLEHSCFHMPKGICIINGDRLIFSEMEEGHFHSPDEYKAQLVSALDLQSDSSSDTTGEGEGDNDSSERSGESTFNAFGASSQSSSGSSEDPEDGLEEAERKRRSCGSSGDNGRDQQISLEQSLSYQRMKKYTILHNQHKGKEPGGRAVSKASQHRTTQMLIQSQQDKTREDAIGHPGVRLAVTTDHCVWYVNPSSGAVEILAGHPKLSGYCDDQEGLMARFSSPKAVVNIGSVLLVADYWNNVIRCINLYTTQVDTIVDFAPQGPIAICLSDSGMIYALDGDNIHYANMLRIRSMPYGEDGIGGAAMAEDKLNYESLFSRPRSSRSSFSCGNSELWDVYKQRGVQINAPQKPRKSSSGPGPVMGMMQESASAAGSAVQVFAGATAESKGWKNAWSGGEVNDFNSRLQSHLDDISYENEEENSKQEKKKKKKKKKAARHKLSILVTQPAWGDGAETDPEKRQTLLDPQASEELQAQLTRLSQVGLGSANDGDNQKLTDTQSMLDPKTPTRIRTPLRRSSADKNSTKSSRNASRNSSRRSSHSNSKKLGNRIGNKSPRAIKSPTGLKSPAQIKSPRAIKSPARRKSDVESDGTDYVERTLIQLQQVSLSEKQENQNRMSFKEGLPLTLSDLGIYERGDGRNSPRPDKFAGGLRSSAEAMSRVLYQDNMMYRFLSAEGGENPAPGSSPEAGSVMVQGGKAFYRDTNLLALAGNPSQPSWSQRSSRRGSMIEDSSSMRAQWCASGEDDDGNVCHFVDLTQSRRCSQSIMPESRRDSMFDLDGVEGDMLTEMRTALGKRLSNLRTLDLGMDSNSRRGSTLDVSARRGSSLNIISNSRRGSALDVHSNSRRGSTLQAVDILSNSRRTSILNALSNSRRGSFLGTDNNSRRDSFSGVDVSRNASRRGSYVASRRASCAAVSPRRNSLVVVPKPPIVPANPPARRHMSMGSLELGQRRGSGAFGPGDAGDFTPGEVFGRNRRATLDRNPGTLNIMPTLLDADETLHEEGENDSNERDSQGNDRSSQVEESMLTDNAATGTACIAENEAELGEEVAVRYRLCAEVATILQSADASAPDVADEATKEQIETQSDIMDLPAREATPSTPSVVDTGTERSSVSATPPAIMSLGQVPFTRDLDVDQVLEAAQKVREGSPSPERQRTPEEPVIEAAINSNITRSSSIAATSAFGTYKVAAPTTCSKTWRTLPLPELLSAKSSAGHGPKKYPNTPLSMAWYECDGECYIFVGLLCRPNLLKIIPPKHHEPDKGGRFNVLPVDAQQVLLADESSHQIRLLNHQYSACKHLAGCGKRGYLDGPLETCRMHSPCSMTLDPRSHYIYVADRGNHVIRKIDLMSSLMSTVAGNGTRGNYDGPYPQQALDSPFEVSFVEPHYLIISCSDNSIRSFNLKTKYLETILVGS